MLPGFWRSPPWRLHVGVLLAGWGGFNLVEGLVDHQLLGIHHVRDLPALSAASRVPLATRVGARTAGGHARPSEASSRYSIATRPRVRIVRFRDDERAPGSSETYGRGLSPPRHGLDAQR